jgi:hypothetical protein
MKDLEICKEDKAEVKLDVDLKPPFKGLESFPSDVHFCLYMKKIISPGFVLEIRKPKGSLRPGDDVIFHGIDSTSTTGACLIVSKRGSDAKVNVGWIDVTIHPKQTSAVVSVSRQDFSSLDAFVSYLKATVKPGVKLMCTKSYECILQGDIGAFKRFHEGDPPVQVQFSGFGGSYWVPWENLTLAPTVSDEEKKEAVKSPTSAKPFKTLSDFRSEYEYSVYMLKFATKGAKVRLVRDYQDVTKGDIGVVQEASKKKFPPCVVKWSKFGGILSVHWRDIVLTE